MKIKFLLLTFALSFVVLSTFSQTFQGAKADRIVSGSKVVRMETGNPVPLYVQLREAEYFPAADFPIWAKKTFGPTDGIGFSILRKETDKLGIRHVRYEVTNNEIPVFGAFVHTHGINGSVSSVNGRFPADVSTRQPTISENAALENAKTHIGATSYKWEMQGEEDHLKWETGNAEATYFPKGELVYIDPNFEFIKAEDLRLAYKFDIYAHRPLYRAAIFVDAQTGEILFENPRICMADVAGTAETGYNGTQNIVADSFSGSFRLREAGRGNGIRTFNLSTGTDYGSAVDFTDDDNVWNNINTELDQYATDAHWGAEMAFDYFLSEHGRNSIDNNNMVINNYVHYGFNFANAFWDGQRMVYGDGNNQPLTTLDICGHEMTHGVTEFSANLIYQNESGALNESFSDIFGAALEWYTTPLSADWLLGEDVGTLRNMADPNAFGDPDTYFGSNWYVGFANNGGIHTNSGVQNKWFHILSDGETGINDLADAYSVTGIGVSAAAAIAYRSLTVYLGPTSQYADARFYSIQAATDLFGACSPEAIACTNAWFAVGVGDAFEASVNSDFSAAITSSCQAPFEVDLTNLSSNGASFTWDFGDGQTSTEANPTHVYATNGSYTVTLISDGDNCGADTLIQTNYISVNPNNPCTELMPESGSQTLTTCTGTLYDSGGPNGNYQNNADVVTIISPVGAAWIELDFSSFGLESSNDYLFIYNGPTTAGPLLGQYDGTDLPNGGTVSSSTGSITLRQSSNALVTGPGFALTWECAHFSAAPSPNFMATPRVSCTGNINFTDMSINNATEWLWDFGDGNTSTQQYPNHVYSSAGNYTVTLTVTNGFGSNTVSQNNYIRIERPEGPNATDNARCNMGSVALSAVGNGTLQWYDQPTYGTPIGTGTDFNTPTISTTTGFYVEDVVETAMYNVGPADNTFTGGSNTTANSHLVFDCSTAFVLRSVKVYAQGFADRTIVLRDNTGTVLQAATVYIEHGEQEVMLDFTIEAGNNYQLGTIGGSNLYRSDLNIDYPYEIPDVVSIQTSSLGLDHYYFFYDWQIEIEGCTSERTEVVATINSEPTVSLSADTSICQGDSITLVATGGETYLWDNGQTTDSITVSPTVPQVYSVDVTSAENCVASSSVSVNVNEPPAQPIITFNGNELESSSAENYQWFLNGVLIENAISTTYSPTETGDHTVEISDINGCSSVSEPYNWIAVGIPEMENGIGIYPNPFRSRLRVSSKEKIELLFVFDAQGRLVEQHIPQGKSLFLKTENWRMGVYLMQIITKNGVHVKRVVRGR